MSGCIIVLLLLYHHVFQLVLDCIHGDLALSGKRLHKAAIIVVLKRKASFYILELVSSHVIISFFLTREADTTRCKVSIKLRLTVDADKVTETIVILALLVPFQKAVCQSNQVI